MQYSKFPTKSSTKPYKILKTKFCLILWAEDLLHGANAALLLYNLQLQDLFLLEKWLSIHGQLYLVIITTNKRRFCKSSLVITHLLTSIVINMIFTLHLHGNITSFSLPSRPTFATISLQTKCTYAIVTAVIRAAI